jgi:hypothetical protein
MRPDSKGAAMALADTPSKATADIVTAALRVERRESTAILILSPEVFNGNRALHAARVGGQDCK